MSPPVRWANIHTPASMSRGPISMRSGTPFISYSANFQPGELSLKSPFARMPAAVSVATSFSAASVTPGLCDATGTTTAWIGAISGGRRSPLSSPWVMIMPPIRRVDTPHDVCHGVCSLLSRPVN